MSDSSILDIADLIRGVTYRRDEASPNPGAGLVPVLRATNIQGGRLVLDDLIYVPAERVSTAQMVRKGDIVLAMSSGSRDVVGKAALATADWNGGFGAFCGVLRSKPGIRPEWLARFMQSPRYRAAIDAAATGTNINNLSKSTLASIEVPSVDEHAQLEQAQFLDTLALSSSSSAAHLALASRAIERFRQTVLAAACSGRLTADWRGGQDQLPSAREVLERMRADRPTLDRQSAEPPEADQLETIPDTWEWAVVGEVGKVQLGGTPSRKAAAYWEGGVPWVSSGEVANCRIVRTRETISAAGLVNSNAKMYPVGTVLIAMIGEGKTRGQSAILDIEASTNQNVAGILPDPSVVSAEYVWRWALAQYEITRAVGRGGNQPALNGQKVRELAIPIPPLEEQQEIIRRIDGLLASADVLLARIDIARRRVARSTQAILAKTFRGELALSVADTERAPGRGIRS